MTRRPRFVALPRWVPGILVLVLGAPVGSSP